MDTSFPAHLMYKSMRKLIKIITYIIQKPACETMAFCYFTGFCIEYYMFLDMFRDYN